MEQTLSELCIILCKKCSEEAKITYTDDIIGETYNDTTGNCEIVYGNTLTFFCKKCDIFETVDPI